MKLSFVIPAYNEEKYIGDCLKSILKQTEKSPHDTEIIVVSNASTDRTEKIAGSFPGVKVIVEKIKGASAARHAGYEASTGDLVANIDADVLLPDGWIDKVMEAFEKNPNLVGFSGPYIYHDLSPLTNFGVRIFYYLAYVSYLLNRFIFNKSSMSQGGNFVARKSALKKIGGYNLEFEFYGDDTDIARRLHEVGDMVFALDLLVYTSGRRLAKEGIATMAIRYSMNHFWTIAFKKPFTKKYINIR